MARGVRQLIREGRRRRRAGDGAGAPPRRRWRGWREALQALHVPCVAAEELRLGSLIEVNDLVAVLDVLASPGHDLSLAQALKSPLFGASDEHLLALARRASRPRCDRMVERLAGLARCAALRWRARATCWRVGRPMRAALPPHDLLDRVVDQGELMPRLAAAVPAERRVAALAAVNALLALSLSLDGGRHASVYTFVRALRQRALSVRAPAPPGRGAAADGAWRQGVGGALACGWSTPIRATRARPSPGVLIDWPVELDAPRRVAFVADLATPCASLAELRAAGPGGRATRGAERAVRGDDARARPAAVQPHAAAPRRRARQLVDAHAAARPVPGP